MHERLGTLCIRLSCWEEAAKQCFSWHSMIRHLLCRLMEDVWLCLRVLDCLCAHPNFTSGLKSGRITR